MNMPSPLWQRDRLEQTKAADALDNDCPLYLRITGLWNYDYGVRVSYLTGGASKESVRMSDIIEERGPIEPKRKCLYVWAVIDGKIVEGTSKEIAEKIGVCTNSVSHSKHTYLRKNPLTVEAEVAGVRFGWTFPPPVAGG